MVLVVLVALIVLVVLVILVILEILLIQIEPRVLVVLVILIRRPNVVVRVVSEPRVPMRFPNVTTSYYELLLLLLATIHYE